MPEVASRAHLEAIEPALQRALRGRRASRCADVDAIAVTAGPGLAGALLVGVADRQGARPSRSGMPVYGVNHLAATSPSTSWSTARCPTRRSACSCRGGHSSLLLVADDVVRRSPRWGRPSTTPAGEAFDKVARLLGLPFPGGP